MFQHWLEARTPEEAEEYDEVLFALELLEAAVAPDKPWADQVRERLRLLSGRLHTAPVLQLTERT